MINSLKIHLTLNYYFAQFLLFLLYFISAILFLSARVCYYLTRQNHVYFADTTVHNSIFWGVCELD